MDIFKALGWLNAIDKCSRLNYEDRKLIKTIGKLGLFDPRIEPILERLRNAAYSQSDPLRKAEILLYCAAIQHSCGSYPQATRDAREAVRSYDFDQHRRAVALWILGIVQWKILHNQQAYRNWAEARRIFQACKNPPRHFSNGEDWYEDPIWEMEVELIARPEEISTWLNRFGSSSLKPRTGQIISSVREKIRQRAYPNIFVLIQDLQNANRCSEQVYERAEIFLEFGLATYQMGNSYFAIELLRKAVLNFFPGIGVHHKQVVARCMLGAVEWMHNSSHNQAFVHWNRCLEDFAQLRDEADRDNLQEKKEWYGQHCDILRSALLEWVKPPSPGDLDNNSSDENESAPTSPASNPGKTDLYQELLGKVEWDPNIADGLIEYERKLAPTLARGELIRRAIDRLNRDNQ